MIAQSTRQVYCRVYVGMVGLPADHTAKRLLVGPVLAGHMMTAMAFLRGIGTLDFVGTHPAFGCTPSQLRRDMGQIGCVEIGVHAPSFKAHSSHVQMLIGKLGIRVIAVQLVDGVIDLLPNMPRQLLVAGRWQLFDALLLQTGAQFCLAAALLAVPLVADRPLFFKSRPLLVRFCWALCCFNPLHAEYLRLPSGVYLSLFI